MPKPETRAGSTFFIGLLVVVSAAFVAVLFKLLQPIFWAATLGVLFQPMQIRIEEALRGRRSLGALLTVLIILVTVIGPALFVASLFVQEASALYGMVQRGELDPTAPLAVIERLLPQATELAGRVGLDLDRLRESVSAAALQSSRFLAGLALTAGQNALRFGLMFAVMVYLLFFALRDGRAIMHHVILALPMDDDRERALFARFGEVARATIKGTLVIGLVQGTLGGLIFWLLGIEGAVIWGVIMVALSVLPAVGAGLVWLPAAILLAAAGAYGKAAILVGFGVLVIGLVDNLLRPILVGRDTRLPDYLVLLSTLGGLTVFGVSGFVIGPVIATMFLAVWGMFEEEQRVSRSRLRLPAGDPDPD